MKRDVLRETLAEKVNHGGDEKFGGAELNVTTPKCHIETQAGVQQNIAFIFET